MPHHETERALPASATATKPNIECHNIARFFPPSTWALKNATLSIHEGESVAITGASGSGNLRSSLSLGYSISPPKVS